MSIIATLLKNKNVLIASTAAIALIVIYVIPGDIFAPVDAQKVIKQFSSRELPLLVKSGYLTDFCKVSSNADLTETCKVSKDIRAQGD